MGRVILHSAERLGVAEVARRAGISRPAVWRWQQRFAEAGVGGLLRDKTRRPGKPATAEATVRRVVALTARLLISLAKSPPGVSCDRGQREMRVKRWVLAMLSRLRRDARGSGPGLGRPLLTPAALRLRGAFILRRLGPSHS